MNKSLCKIPQIYLISWCGNFMERHSFRIVLGHLPETMGKLCLSTQFPHQKIRWNYGILRRELNSKVTCFIKAFYKYNSVWYYWWSRIWNNRLIRLGEPRFSNMSWQCNSSSHNVYQCMVFPDMLFHCTKNEKILNGKPHLLWRRNKSSFSFVLSNDLPRLSKTLNLWVSKKKSP